MYHLRHGCSNSRSPHMEVNHSDMEMKHCPLNVSSSTLQHSPEACTIRVATSLGPNYTTVPNGISSVVAIDETTSDVPLMRSPFAPKIEDNCGDSGIYTMDCMRATSIINEGASILSEGTSLIDEGACSSMSNKLSPSMLPKRVPSMFNQGSPSIMHQSTSAVNEGASGSSGNKFVSNGYIQTTKSTVPEINWLLNQEPAGSEPNIENWLGQIFKTDNLVAGCSLPQELA